MAGDTTETKTDDTAQTSDTPTGADKPAQRTFTQAEVDALIAERLSRKEEQAKKREDAARKAAEEEALTKNGEWQKLAEQRAKELEAATAKLTDYDTLSTRAKTLEAMMSKQLEAARKGLPEPVIKLLDKLTPEEQITWIEENKGTFSKQAATVPATPAPVNDRQTSQAEDAKARAKVGAFVRSTF